MLSRNTAGCREVLRLVVLLWLVLEQSDGYGREQREEEFMPAVTKGWIWYRHALVSKSDDRSVRSSGATTAALPEPRPTQGILSDAVLSRFSARANTHDRENRFFVEDFEEDIDHD